MITLKRLGLTSADLSASLIVASMESSSSGVFSVNFDGIGLGGWYDARALGWKPPQAVFGWLSMFVNGWPTWVDSGSPIRLGTSCLSDD
jgi:hypothetical protein